MSDKQVAPNLPPLTGGGGNNGGASQQTVRLQQVLATAQGLNVLTTGAGQQFVITSQVSGLTQVIPGSITTSAGVQQVGVTRIVNISSSSPRVSVMGLGTASTSSLSSPSRQSPAKVVLSTSPKLVRTLGNVFVTPTPQSSIQTPARKRLKLSESTEKAMMLDDSCGYRRRIMEHKMTRMRAIREKYAENASELFFLHAGGNMMDFQNWRKRPATPQYLLFLRQHRLDPEDDDEDLSVSFPTMSDTTTSSIVSTTSVPIAPTNQSVEVKIPGTGVTPVAVSTMLPVAVAQLNQQGQVPGRPPGGRHGMVFAIRAAISTAPSAAHLSHTSTIAPTIIIGGTPIVPESPKPASPVVAVSPVAEKVPSISTLTKVPRTTANLATPQPIVKLVKLPTSPAVSTCDITNNQEQIVEKAKQEAYVMQRISELQREGLWSERRLPKVQEPSRSKAHWDYLLEEMVWLAADFAQERKWKKAAAKKCARMVQKHFQEKAIQAQKAEKSQELRLKKIAGFVAKEIKTFWANVEKLVEYKQQTRLEEKRKKALDQHLNFIVGQTEKYSTWLTEGLNKTDGAPSISASMNSSRISSPVPVGKHNSDDEFEPNQTSDDDEETIARAEEEMKSTTNHTEEVELLKRESELPLEDLLKELPPNYLEERDKSLSPVPTEPTSDKEEKSVEPDEEFTVASEESSDDEDTIMEQEKLECNQDHKEELNDLKAENEMSIDELMAKYGNLSDLPMEVEEDSDEDSSKDSTRADEDDKMDDSEVESESADETKDEDSQTQSDDETNVGLKSLLEDLSTEKSVNDKILETTEQSDQARNEMDDVAALAESIQPKGNTLLTTSVVTKIPFLLKHSLREYQHIGLDWLVTMFDRKLNGILADEMGLGKTIQTIALLAHLACEKGNWGPHLIIVPTSVMLNWEMECKKWCPGFKILTYYGTQKERKQKRTGWTKPNAFHICITSYKLVIQDHQSFRRKKWKYLILDEAQNIKNFKSQRWQLLLNFQTQRRLLLTGTPLQNNLMELWSLMHFLMPNVFQSHREFKEWFSNPVTGMIEGNSEYNENIIRRLHKVLRPFLLRRLKTEVEKQLPKKYEHVVMCRLSKRQRYLYDDFMSRAKTKETLASGNLLSVINVLMQLRKVCNHPNLFEVRPTVSPFQMEGINFVTASLVWSALDYDPLKHLDLSYFNFILINLELTLTAFAAHRTRQFQTPRKLIEEIDCQPEPSPRCPPGKIKINVRLSNQSKATTAPPPPAQTKLKNLTGILPTPRVGTSPLIKSLNNQTPAGQGVTLRVASGQQLQGYSVQLVQHQGSVKAIPVATLAHTQQTTSLPTTVAMSPQRITVANTNIKDGLQRLTAQTVTVKQGDSVQRIAVPSFAQLVQTSTGRHIILTSNQQNTNTVSFPVMTSSGQRLTVLSKSLMGLTTSVTTVNRVMPGVVTTTTAATSSRPIMRVPPLNVTTSLPQVTPTVQASQQLRCGIMTRNIAKEVDKNQSKQTPKSEFHLPQLEEERRQRQQAKLQTLANTNERRCSACPLYGEDLFTALRIVKPATICWHGEGWTHSINVNKKMSTRKEFFSRTEALAEAISSTEQVVQKLKEIFERFVVYVPAVQAPVPRFHVSHPPPHKLWAEQRLGIELQHNLSPRLNLFHPIASAMSTQFPDPRLIQYDCGKLQSLDRLLRQLKAGSHRVLIFTQMTRMLDVLEAFLNFHGHIYLRLDGATKVDQRQVLMERFNGDRRIFCFILSTRSGGVGVNLTGADTVIFYDSDWNPTMDAQAQDRCHRIGQTRDVHIYRLVSEKTVEENILKKANQKRLLGDLAIEGGNFTTAYFKSSTIQDLFNVDQVENDASTRMAEVLDRSKDREKILHKESLPVLSQPPPVPSEEKAAIGVLESALAAAEEDLDVQAARTAKAEAVADLAEFDENIPLDDFEKEDNQVSKAEQEVQHLVEQLTPIERYAMKFVEESEGSFSAAQLAAAEKELEQQKKEWELGRLRALREEEERRMRMADDDEKPLTFGREDAQNQVNNTNNSKKVGNKKVQPSRRSTRKGSRSIRESSESETETTESESQEDHLEDSPDEESSHTESQSQEDEDDDEDAERTDGRRENESKSSGSSRNRNKSDRSTDKNHWDLNSPRTRSRGDVKINLWTLDVSPILPGVKPVNTAKNSASSKKRTRPKSDEVFLAPSPPDTSSNVSTVTGGFRRRPDTPLPNANNTKAMSRRPSCNSEKQLDNPDSLSKRLSTKPFGGVTPSKRPATPRPRVKLSSRFESSLKSQAAQSTLIVNIKTNTPTNEITSTFKAPTPVQATADAYNIIWKPELKETSNTGKNVDHDVDAARKLKVAADSMTPDGKRTSGNGDMYSNGLKGQTESRTFLNCSQMESDSVETDHISENVPPSTEFETHELSIDSIFTSTNASDSINATKASNKYDVSAMVHATSFTAETSNEVTQNHLNSSNLKSYTRSSSRKCVNSDPEDSKNFGMDLGDQYQGFLPSNDTIQNSNSDRDSPHEKPTYESSSSEFFGGPITTMNNSANASLFPPFKSRSVITTSEVTDSSQSDNEPSNPSFSKHKKETTNASVQELVSNSSVSNNTSINILSARSSSVVSEIEKIRDKEKLGNSTETSVVASQFDNFNVPTLPSSQKSVSSTTLRFRLKRPDTPCPGVTTRNQKSSLTGDSLIAANILPGSDSSVTKTTFDVRRITRSGVGQRVSSVTNDSLLTNKTVTRILPRPDTPFPLVDMGRVTRSSASRTSTPLPTGQKPMVKASSRSLGSDTLSSNIESVTNQTTRSVVTVNSTATVNSSPSRPLTRSSLFKIKHDFQIPNRSMRKSRSNSSARLQSLSHVVSNPLSPRTTRRLQQTLNTNEKHNMPRQRPDTPMPVPTLTTRVTRSTSQADSFSQSVDSVSLDTRTASEGTDNRLLNHITSEHSNSRVNFDASSSQESSDLSPQKLKTKLVRSRMLLTSLLPNDSSNYADTDSNANAVRPSGKTEPQSANDELNLDINVYHVRPSLNSPIAIPDSTTKIENDCVKFSSDVTTSVEQNKTDSFCQTLISKSSTAHNTNEPISNETCDVPVESCENMKDKKSVKVLPSNQSRMGTLHRDSSDTAFYSDPEDNSASNSHIPKSFRRINRIEPSPVSQRQTQTTKLSESSNDSSNCNSKVFDNAGPIDFSDVSESTRRLKPDFHISGMSLNSRDVTSMEQQSVGLADSTVVTYIDLDHEPEFMPPPKKYRRKRRRARGISTAKPVVTAIPGEIEFVEPAEAKNQASLSRRGHVKSFDSEKSNNGLVS